MTRLRAAIALMMFAVVIAACSSSSNKATPATTQPPAASTTSTTSAAASSARGAALVSKAMANARKANWVHIDVHFVSGGKTIDFSQDSGPATGRQTVTIGTEHATVLVIGKVAYVNADAGALKDYIGLPASSAAYAGKWISIQQSDSQYPAVSSGVTLAAALKQVAVTGPFAVTAPTVVNGRNLIGVKGTTQTSGGAPQPGTLYVPVTGEVLPVTFNLSNASATERAVFSKWGTAVTLTVPPNPVAFSKIAPAPPTVVGGV